MYINPNKIDEKIRKLQEIRRIASDPELVQMLFEFIDLDENKPQLSRRVAPPHVANTPKISDDVSDLVDRVFQAVDGK
jgi:hypothetical protein